MFDRVINSTMVLSVPTSTSFVLQRAYRDESMQATAGIMISEHALASQDHESEHPEHNEKSDAKESLPPQKFRSESYVRSRVTDHLFDLHL